MKIVFSKSLKGGALEGLSRDIEKNIYSPKKSVYMAKIMGGFN
jgi:hypothetical protein